METRGYSPSKNVKMADVDDDINDDRDLVTDNLQFMDTINISSRKIETGKGCEERYDSGINCCSFQSIPCASFDSVSLREKSLLHETIPEQFSEKLAKISLEDEAFSSLNTHGIKCAKPYRQIVIDFSEQDKDGDTFVSLAIIGGNEFLAITLIDMVPNVECLNIPNSLYQRPLHLAVLTKQVKVLEKLLSKNTDLSCQDQEGNTPLHLACRNGDIECVKTILKVVKERRALQCLEIRNSHGMTCLHVAAKVTENKMEIVCELIESEANVNAVDSKSGRTILHYACEKRDIELVRFLVKSTNIDIDFPTFGGKPAIYIAFWRNYQDIVKLLVKAGADFDFNVLNDVSEDSDDENV